MGPERRSDERSRTKALMQSRCRRSSSRSCRPSSESGERGLGFGATERRGKRVNGVSEKGNRENV